MKDWAIKMGMSVLLGKNIYNITELVNFEVLINILVGQINSIKFERN